MESKIQNLFNININSLGILEKGYELPSMVVEGTDILKRENKWDENDMKETPKRQGNECLSLCTYYAFGKSYFCQITDLTGLWNLVSCSGKTISYGLII